MSQFQAIRTRLHPFAIFSLHADILTLEPVSLKCIHPGEGLIIHASDCAVAQRLQHKDSERFTPVEWSEELQRSFETGIVVTVSNGKGVLARVAAALASAEVDINHVDMGEEEAQDATDLRFIITVRDRSHLELALQKLKRIPAVLRALRIKPASFPS